MFRLLSWLADPPVGARFSSNDRRWVSVSGEPPGDEESVDWGDEGQDASSRQLQQRRGSRVTLNVGPLAIPSPHVYNKHSLLQLHQPGSLLAPTVEEDEDSVEGMVLPQHALERSPSKHLIGPSGLPLNFVLIYSSGSRIALQRPCHRTPNSAMDGGTPSRFVANCSRFG
jgi:hypothetical protein